MGVDDDDSIVDDASLELGLDNEDEDEDDDAYMDDNRAYHMPALRVSIKDGRAESSIASQTFSPSSAARTAAAASPPNLHSQSRVTFSMLPASSSSSAIRATGQGRMGSSPGTGLRAMVAARAQPVTSPLHRDIRAPIEQEQYLVDALEEQIPPGKSA
jgi:hypothetical protein